MPYRLQGPWVSCRSCPEPGSANAHGMHWGKTRSSRATTFWLERPTCAKCTMLSECPDVWQPIMRALAGFSNGATRAGPFPPKRVPTSLPFQRPSAIRRFLLYKPMAYWQPCHGCSRSSFQAWRLGKDCMMAASPKSVPMLPIRSRPRARTGFLRTSARAMNANDGNQGRSRLGQLQRAAGGVGWRIDLFRSGWRDKSGDGDATLSR